MSVHEAAAEHLLGLVMKEPGAVATMNDVRERLAIPPGDPGGYDPGYADAIGQDHWRAPHRWPMAQLAAFTRIHAGLAGGTLGSVRIGGRRLFGGPNKDADRDGNAAMLAELNGPFTATVDPRQHNGDQDGTLTWAEPARCERSVGVSLLPSCRRGGKRAIIALTTLEPMSVPLEIGTSLPSRTLYHLVEDQAVARWPYGSDWITLIYNFNHWYPDIG